MPTFLWFYIAGLTLALAVGMGFYYVIGGHAAPLFESLFGKKAGYLWGRSFRLMLVASALLGGLSVEWYGCSYSDYGYVAGNQQVMVEKMTEQVSGAMDYATWFLIAAAVLGALMYAVLGRAGDHKED